jgi:hypothetical protein
MKLKEYQIVFAVVFAPLILLWGCKSNQLVSPTHVVTLGVSVSTQGIKAKFFNATEDAVYYNITGPQMEPIQGYAGTFDDGSGSGSVSFTLNNIPVGADEILSVEIDDASSGYAQGIGATSLASVDNGVTVEMGSLVRPCYDINPSTTFSCSADNGGGRFNFNDVYVGFDTAEVSTYDMKWVPILDASQNCTDQYDLVNGWTGSGGTTQTIAYLGNSDSNYAQMVNYDTVPPDNQFHADGGLAKQAAQASTTVIQAYDVFCVKLQGGTGKGGHAWVLFTSSGNYNTAPQFQYRLRNDSTPYFSYDVGTTDFSDTSSGFSNCNLTEETLSVVNP